MRHSQTERKPQGGAFGHKAKTTAPRRRASARAARTRAAQLDALLRGTFAEPAAVPTDPSRRNVASFRYAPPALVAPPHAPLRADLHPAASWDPPPLDRPDVAHATTRERAAVWSFARAPRLQPRGLRLLLEP